MEPNVPLSIISGPEMDPNPQAAAAAAADAIVTCPTYFAFWSRFPTTRPLFSHSMICAVILLSSATIAPPFVQPIIQPVFAALSLVLLRLTFVVTAVVALLHQTGALRRYVLKFAEKELSKIMNGTLVTVSDAYADLYRGKVVVTDLMIHNKNRDQWEWDSPCLARVGRIEASLNILSVIQLPFIGRICGHTFFDIYTILVEDVQIFVEKRKNIFNFHMLDGSLDIPDHELIMSEYKLSKQKTSDELDGIPEVSTSKTSSHESEEERGDVNAHDGESASREDEANKLVEKLVGAVSTISKAANQGPEGLKSALRNQKDGLVKNLKQLHTEKASVNISNASKGWRSTKKHGVSLMREVTKVVEKNVDQIKDQVAILAKPPEKKEGWAAGTPDDIRVGSILFREARVFQKDLLVTKNGEQVDGELHSQQEMPRDGCDETSSGWSKPIVIFEMAITGAELSPAMSARDKDTGMPVVGIPIDRFVDIIAKRIVAEVAKSNTGRLFHTAFGDVFSFVHENQLKKNT